MSAVGPEIRPSPVDEAAPVPLRIVLYETEARLRFAARTLLLEALGACATALAEEAEARHAAELALEEGITQRAVNAQQRMLNAQRRSHRWMFVLERRAVAYATLHATPLVVEIDAPTAAAMRAQRLRARRRGRAA